MSKTIINIKSLTINVPAGRGVGVPQGLMDIIMASIGGVRVQRDDEPATDHPDASAAAADPVEVTPDAVVAFIGSDPRFTLRSFDAIAEHFGNSTDLHAALDALVISGKLETKRRRADGANLYKAVVQPEAAEPSRPLLELTETNVRSFLTSDPRYSQRSLEAIAKHFAGYDLNAVEDLLGRMNADGDVSRTTRRADGAHLYEAV
jgi:hypothetical protein